MKLYCSNKLILFVQVLTILVFVLPMKTNTENINPAEISGNCIDCHDEMRSILSGTAHTISESQKNGGIYCINCHPGWENHLNDPSSENITNPSKVDPYKEFDICNKCHFGNSEIDFAHAGKHFQEGVNCSGCHTINTKNDRPEQLKKGSINATCNQCHSLEMASFSSISSHPIKSGGITCVDCHNYFSAVNNRSTTDSENRTCYRCHSEKEGPFIFEHDATRYYGLEDGGCLNCHKAHGSPFQYLLKEPDIQMCQQCHIVPEHLTAHNGEFAGRDCLDCHIDIHGSNHNDHYFSDWILGSDCFNPACHGH